MNRWFAFLFLLLSAALVLADAPKPVNPREFLIEPIPKWTTSKKIEDRSNPLEKQATAGVFFLLFNVEINGATHERFIHVAQKYLSSAGVEANSRLSFTFDPAYQELILHRIVVHRGDRVLNQLEPDRIRVVQQEKELDRLIYNGEKTALLFLEDVRVGDWVEFAYTIRGRNPIEAGHFFDALQLRYPFPIQTENYRLLWPRTNSPLWVQVTRGVPQNRKVTDHFYEYAWDWENRPGEEMEDYVHQSTLQFPMAHFSDYKTWADVATWAEKLFRTETVSEELYQKIMEIRDENKTDEQRVLKALQFVQDDIRYLGIENGISSHQPSNPSVVLGRGYGDCKDKALLFCMMLRFFDGVDASPVLVSTRFRAGVKSFIATPLIFDHVIVRVILNKSTNFVDVTRSYQRGSLDRRFVEYYGAGVLLDENAPGLITVPDTNAGMPKTRIEEHFDISTNGTTKIRVTSTYEGRDADIMRQGLASVNQDAMEKHLLAFYQKFYQGIVTTAPPKLHDDEQSNRIQIIRSYFVPNIWKPIISQTNFISCEFVSHGIFDRLHIPPRKERKFPMALPFPENYIHTIRIEPHEPWRVTPREKLIQTEALLFRNKITCTNDQIEVTCQIMSMRPGIKPSDMPEFWAALDEIPHFLGLAITKPVVGTGGNNSVNWSILLAGIFYSAVLLIAAVAVYRYKLKSPPQLHLPNPDLQGLGGWLILLGIGLITTPFIRIHGIFKTRAVYSVSNWHSLTNSAASGYDSTLAPILLYELFLQLTLIVFSLLLIALFFRKKRIFRTALIVYLSFQFIGFTLDEALTTNRKDSSMTTNTPRRASPVVAQNLMAMVIWGLYVSRSKRVKLTFVN